VKILDAAEKDLEDGYRFYERTAPGLGSYFLDSVYSDIDSLSYFGGSIAKSSGTIDFYPSGFHSPFTTRLLKMKSWLRLYWIVARIQAGRGKN